MMNIQKAVVLNLVHMRVARSGRWKLDLDRFKLV